MEQVIHATRLGVLCGRSANPSTVVKDGINDLTSYRMAIHETMGVIAASITAQDLSTNVKGMVE